MDLESQGEDRGKEQFVSSDLYNSVVMPFAKVRNIVKAPVCVCVIINLVMEIMSFKHY